MRLFDLTGRVALVTGGNGGIGLGIARGLAAHGAAVVLAGRNPDKNERARAALDASGARVLALRAELTDEAAVAALVEAAAGAFGGLDIVVNNAGMNIRRAAHEASLDEWRTVLDGNLTSTFLVSRAAHPHLKRRGGGKVINVGSMMSIFGLPLLAAYGAAKGGIVQLTKSQACAWAADGIQVNAVLPGWITTELSTAARREVPGLDERVRARTPAGRWGQPDDLAGIAVFLASRASDYVTGTAIPVDGGYACQG